MSPTEELRQAALAIQVRADCGPGSFWSATADLLNKIAWMGELDEEMLARVGCDEAIAMARAYLERADR